MKVIYNKYIPFSHFYAITIIKWIFIKEIDKCLEGTHVYKKMLNHESIHEQQILDFTPEWMPSFIRYFVGSLCFYLLYLIEWLFKLFIYQQKAYHNLSSEREAYKYQADFNYISIRQKRQWLKYIFKKI